jgi:hypothetical protein
MDFKGERRTNDTHESTTDPEAKLVRKGPGKEARLCFAGHATMENRNGLCVLFGVKPAVGAPESAVAVEQMTELHHRGFTPKTVGADKGYHTREFVEGVRAQKIVPHCARKDGQKTLHVLLTLAHAISQKLRKRIEEIFGWAKTTGCFRKSRYRGVARTHAQSQYVVAASNLVRMAKLLLGSPPKGDAPTLPSLGSLARIRPGIAPTDDADRRSRREPPARAFRLLVRRRLARIPQSRIPAGHTPQLGRQTRAPCAR